jgi:LysM domain
MVAIYAPRQREVHGAEPAGDSVDGARPAAPATLPGDRGGPRQQGRPGHPSRAWPARTGDGSDAELGARHSLPGWPESSTSESPDVRRRLPDRATRLRRRRLAVLVAAVVVVAGLVGGVRLAVGLSGVPQSTGPEPIDVGPVSEPGTVYVVQPGDTLWSIAEAIAPDADPRPVVDALREANGGPTLHAGDRLRIDVEG